MLWIKEVEMVDSLDELKSSRYRTLVRLAEIHVYGGNIILVATGDVLSLALVYPDSFQLSPLV